VEFSKESRYKDGLNYEEILSGHLSNIARYRDLNPRTYASSVDTMILMCPDDLRKDAKKYRQEIGLQDGRYTNLSPDKIRLYDMLWEYVNLMLENNNLIFRTSYIKTYE